MEVRRLAEGSDDRNFWVRADSQSAGRGRRGREWVSQQGNLFCTGLFSHDGPMASAAQLGFVAAIAVAQMCEHYAPDIKAQIKWPNDVKIASGESALCGAGKDISAKISGILLESGERGGKIWVSVGIGVNLTNAPDNLPYVATHLSAHMDGAGPSAIEALAVLSEKFEILRTALISEGFDPTRKAWLARAIGMGQTVTARLGTRTIIGTMAGMADDGALRVMLPDGNDTLIASGEVFFNEASHVASD